MRWEDWPDPKPGVGEVLLETLAVAVCGSDVHGYTGQSGRRQPPMIMGHEAVGRVVGLGDGVSSDWSDRTAVLQPIVFCAMCDECRQGAVQRCRSRRFIGGSLNGAMAERVAIPASNLVLLPEAVNPVLATLAEPLAVGIHAASRAGNLNNRTVLIAGSGPIGLLAMVAARAAGAGRIITTDIAPSRRGLARALGADASLDPSTPNGGRGITELVGGEVDVAFDAVGIPATFGQALAAIRPGGLVVAIGGWQSVPLDLIRIVTREVIVLGTFNYTPAEFTQALQWLADGRLDAQRLVSRVCRLEDGAAVFAELAAQGGGEGKTVLTRGGSEAPADAGRRIP
jgi:2-desacetyl-2-hydroxyethyl bacteriochlorophyllide A dehydrogenase